MRVSVGSLCRQELSGCPWGARRALLHLDDPRQGEVGPTVLGSDRQGEVVERDGQPLAGRHLDRQLIVASPDVLHERMAGNDDSGATVLLESSHRSQPCLQAAVIGLDPVVGVLLGAVPGADSRSSCTTG